MADRKGWGGKRTPGPGKDLGRPPLGPELRRVTVTLPAEVVDYLRRLGCGNVSRGVRVMYDVYARDKKPGDA